MKNCLLTKLAGTVNNPSLYKLSEIRIEVSEVSNAIIDLKTDGDVKPAVTVFSGSVTVDYTYVSEDSIHKFTFNGTGVISIITNYKITYLYTSDNLAGVLSNKNPLLECKNIETFRAPKMDYSEGLDISVFANFSSLRVIYLGTNTSSKRTSIYGDIKTLKGILPSFRDFDISKTGISGDFKYLALLTTKNAIIDTNIAGSIEDYVAVKRGLGVTTGSIEKPWLGGLHLGYITFNGQAIANQATNTISWTDSTITYNGVTIDNSDVDLLND